MAWALIVFPLYTTRTGILIEGIRLFQIVSGDVTGENATDRMEPVSLEVQRVTALSVDAAGEHPKKTYPWAWEQPWSLRNRREVGFLLPRQY